MHHGVGHMHPHTNSVQPNKMKPKVPGAASYEHPQLDSFSKLNLIPGNAEKQHLSQSSGFSTFDTFSLRNAGYIPEPIRLDQMVTLSIFKSMHFGSALRYTLGCEILDPVQNESV